MRLIPNAGKVLIKSQAAAKATPGGIALPDNREDGGHLLGEVLATGRPLCSRDTGVAIPMFCAVGDVVLYSRSYVMEIEDQGEKFYLADDDDIFAKLNR